MTDRESIYSSEGARAVSRKVRGKTAGAQRGRNEGTAWHPLQASRRVALLIGNSRVKRSGQYDAISVPGVKVDLESLGRVLRDKETANFEVRAILDPALVRVRREIERLAREAQAEDTIVIYYSGTSVLGSDGQLYMPVMDSEQRFLQSTCLDGEFVLSSLRRSQSRRKFVLIDGCHSGALFAGNRGIPDGFCALTSCGENDICYSDDDGGFFTQLVVKGLLDAGADEDGDGSVSTVDLFRYVRQAGARSAPPMRPRYWSWNLPDPIPLVWARQRLFLCYAREDNRVADEIVQRLRGSQYPVWVDRSDIAGATSWQDEVKRGIARSDALLFLLSAESLSSNEVYKELTFAIAKGKRIVPIRLDNTRLNGWYEENFGGVQQIKYGNSPGRKEVWWGKLVEALKKIRLANRTKQSPGRDA